MMVLKGGRYCHKEWTTLLHSGAWETSMNGVSEQGRKEIRTKLSIQIACIKITNDLHTARSSSPLPASIWVAHLQPRYSGSFAIPWKAVLIRLLGHHFPLVFFLFLHMLLLNLLCCLALTSPTSWIGLFFLFMPFVIIQFYQFLYPWR